MRPGEARGGRDLTQTGSKRWSEKARRAADGAREHMREARERWQGGSRGSSSAGPPPDVQTGAERREGPAELGELPSACDRGEAVESGTEQPRERRDRQRADLEYAVRLLKESSKTLDEVRAHEVRDLH
jgi:hypothetical protein